MNTMNIKKEFAKYVSLNILGMVGMSCYIIADTYFISKSQGSMGITALNLVLPVYNLIFGIGSMIGIGSAIRYSIAKSIKHSDAQLYLFNAIVFTTFFGLIFTAVGLFAPEKLLLLLGADDAIAAVGKEYTRIFMSFGPLFMWNMVANAYCRNDGAPTIATISTLASSFFNIVLDYILMFPLGMGMEGAALATAFSPLLGIMVCMLHFLSKKSNVKLKVSVPSVKRLLRACKVGVSAFVGDVSTGVTTMAFNYIILAIAGNTAVAAYAVIANIALVVAAVFNGISNGSQPLISRDYGAGKHTAVKTLKNLSFITALVLSAILYSVIFLGTDTLISIFNGENNHELYNYAYWGVRLYFTGIFFASANIVGASFFSATDHAKNASLISVLRGFCLIVLFAVIGSRLFGLNGVWLSYTAGEAVTALVMLMLFLVQGRKAARQKPGVSSEQDFDGR